MNRRELFDKIRVRVALVGGGEGPLVAETVRGIIEDIDKYNQRDSSPIPPEKFRSILAEVRGDLRALLPKEKEPEAIE